MQLDELKCRKRVLRRLGFTTNADVVEMKGRVACEISTGDELLLTEMIFNGVFNPLLPEQCAALLSCFVFTEKVRDVLRLFSSFHSPDEILLRAIERTDRQIKRRARGTAARNARDGEANSESFNRVEAGYRRRRLCGVF